MMLDASTTTNFYGCSVGIAHAGRRTGIFKPLTTTNLVAFIGLLFTPFSLSPSSCQDDHVLMIPPDHSPFPLSFRGTLHYDTWPVSHGEAANIDFALALFTSSLLHLLTTTHFFGSFEKEFLSVPVRWLYFAWRLVGLLRMRADFSWMTRRRRFTDTMDLYIRACA